MYCKHVYFFVLTEVEEQTQGQVAVLQEVTRVLLNFITTTPDAWAPIVSSVSQHSQLFQQRCSQLFFFCTCCILMHKCCHVWPWLIEFGNVVLSCFTLSCSTTFTEVSPIKLEDSPIPLFKAIFRSVSLVRRTVNIKGED